MTRGDTPCGSHGNGRPGDGMRGYAMRGYAMRGYAMRGYVGEAPLFDIGAASCARA